MQRARFLGSNQKPLHFDLRCIVGDTFFFAEVVLFEHEWIVFYVFRFLKNVAEQIQRLLRLLRIRV